jgi:chemotaxis response regulator CheB
MYGFVQRALSSIALIPIDHFSFIDSRLTPTFDVVALAGSAGSLPAFQTILRSLPARFAAAVIVLQHRRRPHQLERALAGGPLPVQTAVDGVAPARGRVYVVPGGYEVRLSPAGRLALAPIASPFLFDTADILLASMGRVLGRRGLAVVLSGTGEDGAAGAMVLRDCGGTVLVQDAATSVHSGMATATIARGAADFTLPLSSLATALIAMAAVPGAAAILTRAGAGQTHLDGPAVPRSP